MEVDPLKLYNLGQLIEKRSYYSSYTGESIETKQKVTIKIFSNSTNDDQVKQSIEVMKSYSSPYITSYTNMYTTSNELWVIMEDCQDESLIKYISNGNKLNEPEIREIVSCCLLGLLDLHNKSIIHRNINPNTIALSDKGIAKLNDCGLPLSNSFLMYCAPEVFNKQECVQSDVWSLGITIIELAQGINPYADSGNDYETIKNTICNIAIPSLQSSEWSSDFVDFVKLCLIKDPTKRPSVASLINHNFVNDAVKRIQSNHMSRLLYELVHKNTADICNEYIIIDDHSDSECNIIEDRSVTSSTAVDINSVTSPTAVETNSVNIPTAVDINSVTSPTAVETNSVNIPTAVETNKTIVEINNRTITEQSNDKEIALSMQSSTAFPVVVKKQLISWTTMYVIIHPRELSFYDTDLSQVLESYNISTLTYQKCRYDCIHTHSIIVYNEQDNQEIKIGFASTEDMNAFLSIFQQKVKKYNKKTLKNKNKTKRRDICKKLMDYWPLMLVIGICILAASLFLWIYGNIHHYPYMQIIAMILLISMGICISFYSFQLISDISLSVGWIISLCLSTLLTIIGIIIHTSYLNYYSMILLPILVTLFNSIIIAFIFVSLLRKKSGKAWEGIFWISTVFTVGLSLYCVTYIIIYLCIIKTVNIGQLNSGWHLKLVPHDIKSLSFKDKSFCNANIIINSNISLYYKQ